MTACLFLRRDCVDLDLLQSGPQVNLLSKNARVGSVTAILLDESAGAELGAAEVLVVLAEIAD
jgi:hypothetical protein